jgi:phosphatidyl-N-methylethanolamine N-methyltransferase
MIVTALLIAALLLSIERITYLLIWNYPDAFRTLVAHPALSVFGGGCQHRLKSDPLGT